MKRVLRFALLALTLCSSGLFAPTLLAQWTYSYYPDLGEYVSCGSGSYNSWDIDYYECSLTGGTRAWSKGNVRARLDSHNTSTGAMTITVEKCDGNNNFISGGRIIVVGSNSNYQTSILYCSSYSSGSHEITRTISSSDYHDGYGNYIDIYLINSGQSSFMYAGSISISATCDPEATTLEANNVTANSAKLRGRIEPNGNDVEWEFQYGVSSFYENVVEGSYSVSGGTTTVNATVSNLEPETTYKYRLKVWTAGNSSSYVFGGTKYFTTGTQTTAPWGNTYEPTNITAHTAALSGYLNPGGLTTYYRFEYGTTSSYGISTPEQTIPAGNSYVSVSTTLTNLQPNTTYYFRLYAYNNKGTYYDSGRTFTTQEDNCFYDCSSGGCGDLGQQMYTAAQYLCERGIVQGNNGYLNPDDYITRAQLAKTALYGLYSSNNGVNIPNPLVTDYFPSIYPDLQDPEAYYYQAAKALLYLEYGDGVSPFDRDRAAFNPTGNIPRIHVLKVLLETFNIAPLSSGTNVFDDFGPTGYSSSSFWGYAQKAYNLGVVQTTHLCPNDDCTRGEAFLYLYRILTGIANNTIPAPNPVNTESPATSSFFIPANLSPEVVNAMRGVEYGNFNYYENDFFNIPGYIDLNFGIGYNSYLTEMPDDFYPVKPLGKAWTHTYDMYMNIVTDPYNNSSNYIFHMQNGSLLIYDENQSSITEGNYYDLTHPSTTKYVLKSREQISYTFERKSTSDGIYYLTQIKDRNDNAINISYSYGNSHYRITSVSTLGRTLSFYYTSGTDLLYYVKDPMNRKVYFYYTGDQMTSLKDAKNQITNFTYGTMDFEKGLLKEIQLPKGNYVYNNYEQRKLISMSRISATGNTHTDISISPNYQNGSYTSTVTENLGNRQTISTTYTMNAKNRITNVNDGLHTNVSYEYNISGKPDLVSKMTDNKKSIQTTYTYSSKGLPKNVTTSAGGLTRTTQTEYTSLNDISQFTDAKGNVTQYTYSDGNLIKITDALGNQTNFVNNSYGKTTRVTNPSNVVTNYTYDSYGNETEMNIPSVNKYLIRTYDDVSRVTSAITSCDCQTTTYTYDNNDNMLTKADAEGNTTSYTYDANNNLTQITNARGYSTNLSYDNNDFVTSVSFQVATDSYTYNRDGSLATHTDPNGHTFIYTYNNSGEMTSDGYASYSYNNKGQITSVTKDNKSINYSYDAFSRITSIEYDGKTVSYTYDNNDNLSTIIYPGNKTVTYTYDALNRMTSVKDWNNATTNYNYRADGNLNYVQYPNNVRTSYTYDAGGQMVSQTTKRNSGNGTVIASYSYTWDEFGNHTSETFTEPYETYPSIPSANISYSYNAANRLTSAGELSFGYDNNGNTTSRTGKNYGYDTKNNLTSVSGDFTATYTYDGLGNRRSATRNGVTTKYVLDLIGDMSNVLMETDGNGSVKNYYIFGASGLVSRIDANNNTRYYVSDYRGSTVAMTDATTSANITHKYQYDDFGKLLQLEEENENLFRYVGKFGVMHEDNALAFMRARYYDPEIGRFLSEDPIWSTNLYPYADNNSIAKSDPKGEAGVPMNFFIDPAFYCSIYEYWGTAVAQHRYLDAFDLYMDRAYGMNNANTMGQNLASYFFIDNVTNIYKVFGKLGKKIANGLLGISACSTSIKNVKDSKAQWKNKQKQNTYHKSHPFEPYYPNQAVMY
jgi:RHS repeat-associated protein